MKIEISQYGDEKQNTLASRFPKGTWLSDQDHVNHFLLWNTFFRRNPHRFVETYLNITLYWYQSITLYLMFVCTIVVIVAARAAAKSFIIAVYAVSKAILYPNSKIVLTANTRGESALIVSDKILNELCNMSPNLRREILSWHVNKSEVIVKFRSGSTIETVTCNEQARGHRSTVNVGEEARKINKKRMDSIISPFRIVRQAPYIKLPEYSGEEFLEDPCEILLSSSDEERNWLVRAAYSAYNSMMRNGTAMFIAFDYSISYKHGIRKRKQLLEDISKIDPLTWFVEYENGVLRSNAASFFSYDVVKACQVSKLPFYPRKLEDVLSHVRNKYAIPKMPGEVRLVACDIAVVDRAGNDNSAFSCLRLFPEKDVHDLPIFKVQMPYLEGMRGSELRKQAIRIRQLYDDFEADYIVLDVRNSGAGVYDQLARVLYDDERGKEYRPFKAMNDEDYAKRINSPSAEPKIFVISASARLNSDMANNLRAMMINHELELLVAKDEGFAELRATTPEYVKTINPEVMLWYEKPYLETMLFVNETVSLKYEKKENTGLIKIFETGEDVKDRYSSVTMGCWFASLLARDLLTEDEEEPLQIQMSRSHVTAL